MAGHRVGDPTIHRYLNPSVRPPSPTTSSFYGGRSRPRQESCPTGPNSDSPVHSLLESINLTVSEMQRQLFSLQEQSVERDSSIEKLRKEIDGLKENLPPPSPYADHTPKSKRCRKSPRGLSACVRRVHASYNDSDKYSGMEGVNSEHNKKVTQKVVTDVLTSEEFTDRQLIEYACKKHHEYLVRLEKQETVEAKENRLKTCRIIQRRVRLYERRVSQAKRKEIQVMRQLNEKLMSDEEIDCEEPNSFIKRSPPWRSDKLNNLFRILDGRYELKQPSLKKDRKIGLSTDRPQPQGVPSWALCSPAATTSERVPSESPNSTTPTNSMRPGAVRTPSTPRSWHRSTPNVWDSPSPSNPVSLWQPGMTLPAQTPVHNLQEQSFHSSCSAEQESISEESDLDDADSEMDAWLHAVTGVNSV